MVTKDEFARLSNKVEDVATSVFMHHQVQVCVGVHACLRVVWCVHAVPIGGTGV